MQRLLATRLRRRRRLLGWLAAVFVLFSLAGFFLAPVLLKQQLIKHASAALHRPVAIEQVRVNPWTCSVTIRGLTVAAHDGAEFAGWEELYVDFAPAASLFRLTWSLDEIRLVHPRVRLYRETDGTLNIADLINSPAAASPNSPTPSAPKPGTLNSEPRTLNPELRTLNPAPAGGPPPLAIAHLRVERGEFTYADKARSAPFSTTFGPTSFELVDFTTRPNRSGAYTFAAATEAGERFAWQGNLTFEPLGSTGRVAITDLRLPKYAAFHRDLHQLDLLDGRLGVELDYEVSLASPVATARVRNGHLTLADLQLAARGTTTPLATVPLIEVNGLAADSVKRDASLATVLVRDASLALTRRADATIDFLALLQPATAPVTAAAASAKPSVPPAPTSAVSSTSTSNLNSGGDSAAGWSATLGRFEIANATLRVHDLTTPRPADLVADQIALTLTGAGTQLDRDIALTTSLRWNESGRLAVTGTVRPQPLAADLQIEADGLALRPLDPYLAPFLNVLITGGTARAKGRLTFAITAEGAPDLHWTGDAGLAGFVTVDSEHAEPLFGFADLALNNLRATTQPLTITLDEIALKEPFAHVVVLPDKQLNLAAVLKTTATAQPSATVPEPETPNPKPTIVVARVTLAGGRFTATDRSVEPAFATALTEFGGTISGLSSEQLARAAVDLSGRLGLAPLKISGQINPLSGDAFTDLKVTFTGIELPPFTPYSGRFAGYTIDKGKLSLDLSYHLSARELVAENNFALDQFYLGQPVESPDATKLPVKLALAILRDPSGRIAESVPIRGNLDDPDFKYGRVVWRALGNVIVKAATAPFSLLGGLFGGGHDLSAVDFASGSAELDAEAITRLEGLVKALTSRPGLNLEISSQPQRELDLAGLRATQLEALLRARKLRELATTTTAAIDPATVQLTPEETARFVAELHTERGAAALATAAPGTTPVATVAPAAPVGPKRSLVVRTVRRLFGRGEKTAAAASAAPTAATVAPAHDAKPVAGATPAPTTEELRAQLLATFTPTDSEFAALAAERARRIQEYLLTKGQIDSARVFLATAGIPPATGAAPTPRVVFNLQ